jgi:hypothetical protein
MAQAGFAYLVAILLLANSVNGVPAWLQITDVVVAVYFAVVGSIAGWLAARD